MKLLSLEIRQLPGIDRPFSVDFDPDTVNLITGPNGSGKSSLVRAVRAVLYPELLGEYCEVVARWRDDAGTLTGQRISQQVNWTRGQRSTPPPNLAGVESIDAFLISSEDLSAPGKTDQRIATELKRLLTAGYDLDAVASQARLATPSRPQKLARELDDLNRSISEKEQEYSLLHEETEQLNRLREELEGATQAAARLTLIDDALALAEASARRNAVERTLIDEFPGGMDRLVGDEMDRLDRARKQLHKKQQAIVQEHTALKQEEQQLAQTGVDNPDLLEGLQAELADARDRLAATEQRIEAETERAEQAEQAMQEFATRLGSNVPDQAHQLDQAALETLERHVDKVLGLRERIRALTGQLALAQGSRNLTGRPQDDLRAARSALQDWLALSRLSPFEGLIWGTLSVAALIGGLRLLTEADLSGQSELLLLTALAVGLPASMLTRFLLRLRDRNRALENFRKTEIEAPLGWNEPEVRARLKRLDIELEAATQHEVTQLRANDLREQLNQQRTALDRARQQLSEQATSLGLSAEQRLETSFLLWSRNLQDWQHSARQAEQHRTRLQQLNRQYQGEREETAALLQKHGLSSSELSSRTLGSLLNQLLPKIRRHAELFNSIQARERRVGELHADISQLDQQIAEIFDAAGVRRDDLETLRRKSDQFPMWQKLEQERIDLDREVIRLERRLDNEETLRRLAAEQQHSALAAMRESTDNQAAQRDPLNRRIAEIQTRHADTLDRRELERLGAQLEVARDQLEAERERHLLAAAGQFMVREVAAAHRAEQEPAMLSAADQWLGQFTGHRYRLEFDGGLFEAVDTQSGARQAITSLSTGTRAQLMLALRLAWIEQLETRSEPLPLFMDEVLTTTDPDRYRAIVRAAGELVGSGRQIFYLTAQSDDAEAWREWLDTAHPPCEIDMAEVRRTEVRQLEFRMPEAKRPGHRIPDPDGLTAEQWALESGVEAIEPWADAGRIGVFHLLRDDLALAARLMRNGLSRLGPLERFLTLQSQPGTSSPGWLDRPSAERLQRRIQATRMLLDDWQRRHRRPVDRATLEQTGLLSQRFLPRVATLAEQLEGDPAELIQALRNGKVSRFRSDTTDQLEQWLEEQGFLDAADHEPLTPAELALSCKMEPEEAEQLQDWILATQHNPVEPGNQPPAAD